MIIGHYATALIPHARDPKAPLWLFLVAANLPDFLWLVLALAGVEAPAPVSFLDASFSRLSVEMTYSHDIIPSLGLALITAAGALAITRRVSVALWCMALVVAHELGDLVTGFPHHVMGPSTAGVGLNLYGRAPELSLLIEAFVGVVCVAWFLRERARRGRPVAKMTARQLYVAFVVGALAWLPIARVPLRELLGLP